MDTVLAGINIETPGGGSARITASGTVSGVYVPRALRGRGAGRELMAEVLRVADAEGIILRITAQAFDIGADGRGHVGPDTDELDAWYRRLGFTDHYGVLTRKPRTSVSS